MLRRIPPPQTKLLKLCQAKEWSEAKARAMSHPDEATAPSSANWDSTALSIACRSGAPIETIREIAIACSDQLLTSHFHRGTVLHDCIKHRAPLNVVSFILESQKQFERELWRTENYAGVAEKISVFDQRDHLGRTPLHHMMERACQWIVKGALGDGTRIRWRDRDKFIAVTKLLLEAYPEAATASDLDGQTPLSLILTIPATNPADVGIELRILELVRVVLSANPSAALGKCQRVKVQQGQTGRTPSHTPLSCALSHRRSIITVNILIESAPQAALIPVGNERELPLHIAVTMRAPVEVISVLLHAAPSSAIAKDRRSLTSICWAWIRHVVDHHAESDKIVKMSKRRYIPTNYDNLEECAIREIEESRISTRDDVKKHSTLGIFWEKMEFLLRAAHHGSISDTVPGVLGFRPVHAAAAVCCPRPLMNLSLLLYPDQVVERDEYNKLPLHYAASRPMYKQVLPLGIFHEPHEVIDDSVIDDILRIHPGTARAVDGDLQLPLHVAIENVNIHGDRIVMSILRSYADALERRDGKTFLYPFMQAASVNGGTSLTTCFKLLRENPTLVGCGIHDS